jgi:hypothetical protein
MRRALLAPLLAGLALPAAAQADPYRLRADTFVYSQSPQSPVGLVVLQGADRVNPWVDAEAAVWAGTGSTPADAITMVARLHDPRNWSELRLGRQVIAAGAIRPLHLDGGDARLRAPTGTSLEVFGGVPVEPKLGYHAYDWAIGGRLAQLLDRTTTAGLSYLQQRDTGRISYEEIGADFASSPVRWFDLASHAAYDLVDPGLTEAGASLAGRFGALRPELYATHRSPSRLLPATSLFSALGDAPSDVYGASILWRAFPRLDVLPVIAARTVDGLVGLDATLRATLRLDDKGAGALSLEGRRQDTAPDRWTGVRLAARVPITTRVRCATELELVAPDDHARGSLWPWALASLAWSPAPTWDLAGAVESASTAQHVFEMNAIVRLSHAWEGR